MRIATVTLAWLCLTACGLFGSKEKEPSVDGSDDDPDSNFYLNDCDLNCDEVGIDIEIDAYDADYAAVEFWSSATLVETFELTQLDDTTWVGYPEWPNGYSFADCGAEADFVCVVRMGDDEIRESR